MPPPDSSSRYHLVPHSRPLYLFQFSLRTPIPSSLLEPPKDSNTFRSITWTREEVSIVTDESLSSLFSVEAEQASSIKEGPTKWVALVIKGPMDLSLTGIMCDLTTPLKEAKIPIFAISTWNTDYLLIPYDQGDDDMGTLEADGWTIIGKA